MENQESRRAGRRGRRRRDGAPRSFSPARLVERAAALPVISFPPLPVSDHRVQIADAIRRHQVVIVSGETGSGKTTQLPKICLQIGRGISGLIGHTQPRRLAARSVAERIADELGQTVGREPGQVIGYQVRFTDEVGPTTLVKLMTDGILLNEIQTDPDLTRYDTIIVDEAHERSLNIDFILGYLARLLPRRPDLKLIITSATIDSERFASHFAELLGQEVPVIEVSGRTYPVEIRYRPLTADDQPPLVAGTHFQQLELEDPDGDLPTFGYGLGEDIDLDQALAGAVDELLAEPDGDILVFLPGERDIREAQRSLENHLENRRFLGGIEIVPLFARLSAAEQHRIFQPHGSRRIILSTNIAETSLTVPGIRYIIDSGLARVSRYSNKTKVQRLPIEEVSQASANQRAGRAGRLSDGIAIRLYSAADYTRRPEFTEPEILRTSLASVILQMSALGLGEVAEFPFIDAPSPAAVQGGVQLLVEIGALTEAGTLTDMGWQLSRLPIDPRLGRMLLAGADAGCSSEVLVIVAALSIQDVRERPLEAQGSADAAHARFADPNSDFITYLNLWRYLNVQQRDLSGAAFRRLCRSEYLHYLRFREWRDVVGQLRQMCRQLGIPAEPLGEPTRAEVAKYPDPAAAVVAFGQGSRTVDFDQVHRSLLVGLLSNLGNWDEVKANYRGARGTRFTIWPGSGLAGSDRAGSHPRWVMAAELVETSRLFARTVAQLKVEWIEEAAAHLLTRSYSEPYWSRAKGAALIKERTSLYGLTLAADRSVLLGRLGEMEVGAPERRRTAIARPGTIAAIAQGLLADASGSWSSAFLTGERKAESITASELAHEMFIREALVGGKWRSGHLAFAKHNQKMLDEALELEHRSRQPGLVADEEERFAFFAERVPPKIADARSFENWWKRTRAKDPHLLDYRWEDLVRQTDVADRSEFPDRWEQGDLRLALSYDFRPGSASDGVTVTIPLAVLPQVQDEGFDWLVPGMLPDLCAGWIRALPKEKRRQLAPAPDVGTQLAELLQHRQATEIAPASAPVPADDDPRSLQASLDRLQAWGSSSGTVRGAAAMPEAAAALPESPPQLVTGFFPAFASAVSRLRGVELTEVDRDYGEERLPTHLQMHFRVVDEGGREVATGQSLLGLQRQLAKKADTAIHKAVRSAVREALDSKIPAEPRAAAAPRADEWERDALDGFPESPLPRQVESRATGRLLVRGYPALVAEGNRVALRLRSSRDLAQRDHRVGLAHLLLERLRLQTARVTTRWSGREALLLASSPYPSTEALVEDAQLAAAQALVDRLGPEIRTKEDFEAMTLAARNHFEEEVYQILLLTVKALEAVSRVQSALTEYDQDSLEYVRRQVKRSLRELIYPGFLGGTPRQSLHHLPRYIDALAVRLQRAVRDVKSLEQDERKAEAIAHVAGALERAAETAQRRPYSRATATELARLRWVLEELRVSQFAEQLGTSERVSPERLLRQIEAL